MLRDYLLSVGMLKKLDAELKLRAHYSGWLLDPISKFWFEQAPVEWLHRYYLSRVSIELDDYSGLLFVNVQGFSPEMSQAIAIMLLREGDAFMNQMGHQLAQTQVDFLENQVSQMQKRALEARQALLSFQNKKGLASPQAAAENVVTIVAKLQANLSELQTQRSAVQAYLVVSHPTVVQLNQQIAAVEKQITQEQAKLAAPSGKPLNQTVEEYQRLEMQAAFTDAVYKTAISALERGRIEATRTIKKISVLQAPTLPEYPLEPRRLYNTLLSFLVAFLLAGVTQLLVAIVHDHKD